MEGNHGSALSRWVREQGVGLTVWGVRGNKEVCTVVLIKVVKF